MKKIIDAIKIGQSSSIKLGKDHKVCLKKLQLFYIDCDSQN